VTGTILGSRPQTITHDGNGYMFQWGNEFADDQVGIATLMGNGTGIYVRYRVVREPGQRPGYKPVSRRELDHEELAYLEKLLEEKF
jgi:hypothetical protein